jgi:uncharacterized protein (DUF1330 family)
LAELDVADPAYFCAGYMPRVQPMVPIAFDSPAPAREFYHSKDYQDVIGYRLDSARVHLYLLDGIARS